MLPLKMLVLDVDGTLTDGKIYMGEQGELMKAFHAHDAQGLRKLSRLGIKTIILTGRGSNIVLLRAKEMEISQVYQKVEDKKERLIKIVKENNLSFQDVGYIGDDENDLEAMQLCGFKACPFDAVEKIKNIVDYISPCTSGNAAVREIIESKILSEGR